MQYSLSKLLVNGKWRDLLILSDTRPVAVESPGAIIRTENAGDKAYVTTYLTDGLYRQTRDKDGWYSWYLVKSTQTREILTNAETLAELRAAVNVYEGGEANG